MAYAPVVYEPERLAELVTSGQHLATVAVSPDGRIVGHLASEVRHPGATTGRSVCSPSTPTGGTNSLRIGFAHVARLLSWASSASTPRR